MDGSWSFSAGRPRYYPPRLLVATDEGILVPLRRLAKLRIATRWKDSARSTSPAISDRRWSARPWSRSAATVSSLYSCFARALSSSHLMSGSAALAQVSATARSRRCRTGSCRREPESPAAAGGPAPAPSVLRVRCVLHAPSWEIGLSANHRRALRSYSSSSAPKIGARTGR
jgi:hypothetical protein